MSDDLAAMEIGHIFPNIRDKLLNLVQLKRLKSNSDLLLASINQRMQDLEPYRFDSAIDFKDNLKYVKYLIIPFVIVALVGIYSPNVIIAPTQRIIHFNQEFVPKAPFSFDLTNKDLLAFKDEDYILNLHLNGNDIPENAYIIYNNRRIKLNKKDSKNFSYLFEKIQYSTAFSFEAAGYKSKNYKLAVVNRPSMQQFLVSLNFPSYIKRKQESLENIGNFKIPEGTRVEWLFSTKNVNNISLYFQRENIGLEPKVIDNQHFTFVKQFRQTDEYTINLSNKYSKNKDKIKYQIEVIKDQYPHIALEQLRDTVLYKYIILGGNITDDFGLTGLSIFYHKNHKNGNSDIPFVRLDIPIKSKNTQQSFYYHWDVTEINLGKEDVLEYFVQVTDNDAINGRKSTKTPLYSFQIPSKDELGNIFKISAEKTENNIDKTLKDSKRIDQEIKDLNDKLKGKKALSWQNEKQIEKLIKEKEALNKALKALEEKYKMDLQKRERFDENLNKNLKDKMGQLQKLMDELLDDKTKQMYDELQKLLEKQAKLDDVKDMLSEISKKEGDLQQELERTLELFKKMKYEFKLNDNIKQASQLEKEQKKLADKNTAKKLNHQESIENQQELNIKTEQLNEDIYNMQKLNQDLTNPEPMQDFSDEQKSINKNQKEALQNLQENKSKKARSAQKAAGEQLQKLSQKLQSMQSMMMQAQMNMNMRQMRNILDGLIKLSFAQENIMDQFKKVHQSDPRFLDLSENQLNIKDDAKVIQDSLISLSKENFQIQSVVTRKVNEMNQYLDESVDAIRERKKGEAIGKQQFAMTAMNDLALMIDDVMTQMMNAMGMGGGQEPNQSNPSMSQLQKQLSEKISELKKSGKKGRKLSEELANMAAEQERIRHMLEEMENQMKNNSPGNGQNSMKSLKEKMEQSELDLVNKRLTNQLIQRQKEIVTRLLEAENAQKERGLDEKRKAQQPDEFERQIPVNFDKYIKAKEKEIELLKTIPPKLNPYYKNEVNKYFKRLGS